MHFCGFSVSLSVMLLIIVQKRLYNWRTEIEIEYEYFFLYPVSWLDKKETEQIYVYNKRMICETVLCWISKQTNKFFQQIEFIVVLFSFFRAGSSSPFRFRSNIQQIKYIYYYFVCVPVCLCVWFSIFIRTKPTLMWFAFSLFNITI